MCYDKRDGHKKAAILSADPIGVKGIMMPMPITQSVTRAMARDGRLWRKGIFAVWM